MPLEDFRKLLPDIKPAPYNPDAPVGRIVYNAKEEGTIFEDVWITASIFVDNKLSYLGVTYPDFEPVSGGDFVRQASKTLSLPATGWKTDGEGARILNCRGFEVYLSTGDHGYKKNYPSIVLIDTTAEALVAHRKKELVRQEQERQKAEQQRRRVFRP